MAAPQTPSLATFLKSLKQNDIDSSIELLISLLKRRQIQNSRQCAIATAQLLLRVVAVDRTRDAQLLIKRTRDVGRRLVAAQPREMAVGNIVRRILGVIREVVDEDRDSTAESIAGDAITRPSISAAPVAQVPGSAEILSATRPPLPNTTSSYAATTPQVNSLFGLFQQPGSMSPLSSTAIGTTPIGSPSPVLKTAKKGQDGDGKEKLDIKAEVIDGIKELLDELDIVDSQIAESALDHIHSNEIILTHTSSHTVQKFLMAAARKRKFTVIHAEAYPNDHHYTHATIVNGSRRSGVDQDDADERWKPLTAMGITVILIPDSAVFALMSRINKVILAPHTVLANGSLLAAAGASIIAQAAKVHHVPVVVLSGVYKLSPVYPFDMDELIEYGDPGKVVPYQEGEFMDKVDVVNPVFDWVDAELVDLYITNLGGHAPSFLYRIVADHYRAEDIDLSANVS